MGFLSAPSALNPLVIPHKELFLCLLLPYQFYDQKLCWPQELGCEGMSPMDGSYKRQGARLRHELISQRHWQPKVRQRESTKMVHADFSGLRRKLYLAPKCVFH